MSGSDTDKKQPVTGGDGICNLVYQAEEVEAQTTPKDSSTRLGGDEFPRPQGTTTGFPLSGRR